jgi:hypothetical protein
VRRERVAGHRVALDEEHAVAGAPEHDRRRAAGHAASDDGDIISILQANLYSLL